MENMFKNCHNLTAVNISNDYTFVEKNVEYNFTQTEIYFIKQVNPAFTFEHKNIPRLRKIIDTFMTIYHPEDLL